jgi:glycosyltransferase involved in cell wall biosynthesis
VAHKRPPQIWRAGNLLQQQSRHVDAFIALSRFSADKHAEFGFDTPMTVMPPFLPDANAVELSPPSPEPTRRPYCLFVGRLEHIKGLQDVLPLFDEKMPADLLIAGAGSDEGALRALAANRPNVHFLGWCSRERLASLYRSARAVILPSKCFEVFPLVVLEAFQHGVPIVARRLGPYPEIVAAANAGLLFDDAAEFVGAVRTLTCDNVRRDALAAAARTAFQAHYSESVAVTAYLDLIRSIAEKRHLDSIASAFDVPATASRGG